MRLQIEAPFSPLSSIELGCGERNEEDSGLYFQPAPHPPDLPHPGTGPRVKPFHSSVDTLKSLQWSPASLTLADKSISHRLPLSFANCYFQTAGWFSSCYLLHPKAIWTQRLYQTSFLYFLFVFHLYISGHSELLVHESFDMNVVESWRQPRSWKGRFLHIKMAY